MTDGHSSGGDFAIQMHIAFSSQIDGVCGQDAQPYHCAATRFPNDNLVPQSNESSVPFCDGCPPGFTLVYDHCKGHPQWVDVGMLPDYPRRVCGDGGKIGCIDDVNFLQNTSVFLARSECRTYIGGSEVNAVALYAELTNEPNESILYFDDCNPDGSNKPNNTNAMCMQHVLPRITNRTLNPPVPKKDSNSSLGSWIRFNQNEYIDDFNVGFDDAGWLFVPETCKKGEKCTLMISFHGCGGCGDGGPPGVDGFDGYAASNGIVVLKPCIRYYNNASQTYPNSMEIERACWDGYGQLSSQYALQSSPHMRNVWNMIKEVSRSTHEAKTDCMGLCNQ